MTFSFFELKTGIFIDRTFRGPPDSIEHNTPDGCAAIPGRFDHLSQRVDLEVYAAVSDLSARLLDTNEGDTRREEARAELDRLNKIMVIDYQPPRPSNEHEWNETVKRWELSEGARSRIATQQSSLAELEALDRKSIRYIAERLAGVIDSEGERRLADIISRKAKLRAFLV